LDTPVEQFTPLAHAMESNTTLPPADFVNIKPVPIILDDRLYALLTYGDQDTDGVGPTVARSIRHGFLNDAIERNLDRRRQTSAKFTMEIHSN
jgi:hypothetical protein